MQLVVLGMHRSGTSALTRVLNLMGCYAGDAEAFNPVEPDNPKGYWERRDVWALNEELLAALDASWCRVGRLDLDVLPDNRRASFERQAAEIVAALDRHRPWVIKDPRLCVLFPVWRAVLESPVCVIPRRSPLEIAASLAARDGFPFEVSLALWERYTRDALTHSEGLARVFVDHAALIHRPLDTARRLASDLAAVGVEGLEVPDERALTEFIDPALHRAIVDPVEERRRITPARHELVDALAAGRSVAADDASGDGLLAGYFDRIAERDELARQLDDVSAENDALRAERAEAAERIRQLEIWQLELEKRIVELEGLVDDERKRGARARAALEAEIDQGQEAANELESVIRLVLESRRYRLGDRLGNLVDRTRMRPREPSATEIADGIRQRYRAWCRRQHERRVTESGSSD